MTDRLELLAVVVWISARSGKLGDPHWLYHPVRLIGAYISFLEKGIRSFLERESALFSWRCGTCYSRDRDNGGRIRRDLIHLRQDSRWLRFLASVIPCYQLFAVKSLKDESMKVYRELKRTT